MYILLESDIRYVTSPPPSFVASSSQAGRWGWSRTGNGRQALSGQQTFSRFSHSPTSVDFTVESWYIVMIVYTERIYYIMRNCLIVYYSTWNVPVMQNYDNWFLFYIRIESIDVNRWEINCDYNIIPLTYRLTRGGSLIVVAQYYLSKNNMTCSPIIMT